LVGRPIAEVRDKDESRSSPFIRAAVKARWIESRLLVIPVVLNDNEVIGIRRINTIGSCSVVINQFTPSLRSQLTEQAVALAASRMSLSEL